MSEPIKPLDLPLDLSSFDGRGDLSEDQLYAPADVSGRGTHDAGTRQVRHAASERGG